MDRVLDDIVDASAQAAQQVVETKLKRIVRERFEEYMEDYVQEYVQRLHRRHGISLENLLRDLPENLASRRCRGVQKNGKWCQKQAVEEGYCALHAEQGRSLRGRTYVAITTPAETGHTHPMTIPYLDACPACNPSRLPPVDDQRLRDLSHIL